MIDLHCQGAGPPLSPTELLEFERQVAPIPRGTAWLLLNVTNGGWPESEPVFPIIGLEADDRMVLHGLYGIGAEHADLEAALGYDFNSRLLPRLFPFAFDPLDGHLFEVAEGAGIGEIRYIPWDELVDMGHMPASYFVCRGMNEFLECLRVEP